MIAPMLLEKAPSNDDNQSTSHENSESYVQLYVMVINVIKSALLLIASLGPRTTSTLVASTITTSFVMGLITLSWFHFARPQKYVDIQPASIPFINVFKVSSYFSSVVTAMVVIIAHQIGEDGFSSNDMAIVLAFAWIAVIALSYYYFNRWKASKSEFLTEEESLIEFPFKHRDCEKKEIIDIFSDMQNKNIPTFRVSAWYDDNCSEKIRQSPIITNPIAYVCINDDDNAVDPKPAPRPRRVLK